MATCSIRLTEGEKRLIADYARLNNSTISKVLKDAFFEKMEDEFDLRVAEEAHRRFVESGGETVTLDEVRRKYGI